MLDWVVDRPTGELPPQVTTAARPTGAAESAKAVSRVGASEDQEREEAEERRDDEEQSRMEGWGSRWRRWERSTREEVGEGGRRGGSTESATMTVSEEATWCQDRTRTKAGESSTGSSSSSSWQTASRTRRGRWVMGGEGKPGEEPTKRDGPVSFHGQERSPAVYSPSIAVIWTKQTSKQTISSPSAIHLHINQSTQPCPPRLGPTTGCGETCRVHSEARDGDKHPAERADASGACFASEAHVAHVQAKVARCSAWMR